MFKRIITAALLFGMAATGPPVLAQSLRCAPRDLVVDRLATQFSERLTARGLQSPEILMEIWTSADTGTYTVLLTRADGISCVVSTGTDWFIEQNLASMDGIAG